MKRTILTIILLFAFSAFADIKPIEGKWIIVDFIPAPISALSPQEAKESIERGMILYSDWYVTHTQNVKNPIYKNRIIKNEDDFYSEYRMTFEDFGITTESVEEFEVTKSDGTTLEGYGSGFLKISDKRLAICIDGLFVIYEKS